MRLALLFYIVIILGGGQISLAGDIAAPMEPRGESIQTFLRKLSKHTGDLFVLELWCKDDEAPDSFTAPLDIAIINKYTSAEKVIPAYFPRLTVTRASEYSHIYYIADSRLRDIKNYTLNREIPKTVFEGRGSQAIIKLSELVPALKPVTWFSNPDVNRMDIGLASINVSFGTEAKTVRRALSGVQTNNVTAGILWIATTRVRGETHETTVGYTVDAAWEKKWNGNETDSK